MPVRVTDTDTLQKYVQGVMDRALHHGHNVQEILLALAGGVIWRADGDIKVRKSKRGPAGMGMALSIHISGQRYTVGYVHDTKQVEVRKMGDGHQVIERQAFDNSNTAADVFRFFKDL